MIQKFEIGYVPNNSDYYLNLSAIFLDLIDLKMAENTVRKSISINPSFVPALINLGGIEINKGNRNEALQKTLFQKLQF